MKIASRVLLVLLACILPLISCRRSSTSSSSSSQSSDASDTESSSSSTTTDSSTLSSSHHGSSSSSTYYSADYYTSYSQSTSSSSYTMPNTGVLESGRSGLTGRIFRALYSVPFIQPIMRRLCFNSPPEDVFHRQLVNVRPRSFLPDSVQVMAWSLVLSIIKLFVFADYASMGSLACAWFVAYDLAAGALRYAAVLVLQKFENQARQLYAEHNWGLRGPYRSKCPQRQQREAVRSSLRHPVTNALFNWTDQSKAKWLALGKVLLISLGLCALRHLIFLDSLFLVNGLVDLLWLASFWVIVLAEYLKLPAPVLPLLVGLQTIIFR